MKAVNPYLIYPGTALEAFTFYRSVFGGEFSAVQRFGDIPGGEAMPAAERAKVVHVALPLANGSILMGGDAPAALTPGLAFGSGNNVAIETDSVEESTRLFTGLSAGGRIEMPLQEMFWGAFFGSWTDRYGVPWMVNYTHPKKA